MKPLTAHQLSVLRDYEQLGTVAAVADFRGVQVGTIGHTLRICRAKLRVWTNEEAVVAALDGADG
jgi:hypothetical protein